jgi:hypothetical protein
VDVQRRRLDETDDWIRDVLKPAVDALDSSARYVKGRDFGRSGDLSVDRVLQDLGAGRWRAVLTLELRSLPFDVQESIDTWLVDNLPHFHHAKYDARGNGQQLAEAALLKFGPARVECVMATPKWYAEHFASYKGALESQFCELPAGEDELTDHRRIVLKGGYPTMDDGTDKGSDKKQRHGDRAIARCSRGRRPRPRASRLQARRGAGRGAGHAAGDASAGDRRWDSGEGMKKEEQDRFWLDAAGATPEAPVRKPRRSVRHADRPRRGELAPLTGNPQRDLPLITQERMLQIAHWLWEQNPLAHWIVEIRSRSSSPRA